MPSLGGMNSHGLNLEPLFSTLIDGSYIDVVVSVQLVCPGATCCKTVIHNQECITDIAFAKHGGKATIFGAKVSYINGRYWILNAPETMVVSHSSDFQHPFKLVEACSGIGAVSLGYNAAGIETAAYVEQNKKFCEWLRVNQKQHVIEGDIGETATIRQVAGLQIGNHILSAGVSRQPFSSLGDQKCEMDERSKSFPSALKMGHLMQSTVLVLECTTVLDFEPSILAVMPATLPVTKSQLQQLELDLYELRHFHSFKAGISSFVINKCKALPTATHSWGSQVKPCMCGCRNQGFSMDRLHEKGLHGVMHSLDGYATSGDDTFHTMRHVHPREVALLNGLDPKYVSNCPLIPLRLELAAVKQMASPIQSNWIISHVLHQLSKQSIIPECKHPRVALVELSKSILQSRNDLWAIDSLTIYQKIFERELETICKPIVRVAQQDDEPSFTQCLREAMPKIETALCVAGIEFNEDKKRSGKGKGGISTLPPQPLATSATKAEKSHDQAFVVKDTDREQHFPETVSSITSPKSHNASSLAKQEESPGRDPSKNTQVSASHSVDQNGGVAGFETNVKRKSIESEPVESKKIKTVEQTLCSPTQTWTHPITEQIHDEGRPTTHDVQFRKEVDPKNLTVWVGYLGEPHVTIAVAPKTTVGQLIVAESKLTQEPETKFRAFGIVGETASTTTELQHGSILLLQCDDQWNDPKCPLQKTSFVPPNLKGMTRSQALLQQLGWVAVDEMQFYLQSVYENHGILTTPPLVLDETNGHARVFQKWIRKQVEIAKAADGSISVFTCC